MDKIFKRLNKTNAHKQWLIRTNSGFTLVELMVVVAISSIMLAAMYGLFTTLSRSYTTEEVRADAMQDVRSALNMMIRDIRMAGLDPTLSGDFGIKDPYTSTGITFSMDNDSDGNDDCNNFERLSYELSGSQLQQVLYKDDGAGNCVIESTQTVIDNVTNLAFTYLKDDGGTPTTKDEIREVHVSLTVRLPAGANEPQSRTLESWTQCRNLYF